jgi:NADH-quinone oxidoreductase subunit L
MPITFWGMSLAAFSLMGVPLLFSGFWSKDMILEASLAAGQYWIFALAAVTVAVTSFYSVRMLGMTFLGSKSQHLQELEKEGRHIHESKAVMWVPFMALVAGTLAFGVTGGFTKGWLEEVFSQYLGGVIGGPSHSPLVEVESHIAAGLSQELAVWVTIAVSLAALMAGAFPAYLLYIRRKVDPAVLLQRYSSLRALRAFLFNRWYINRIVYAVFVYPMIGVSQWVLEKVELGGIDRFNYVLADATRSLTSSFRRSHTGVLTHNMVAIIFGLVALFIIMAITTMG